VPLWQPAGRPSESGTRSARPAHVAVRRWCSCADPSREVAWRAHTQSTVTQGARRCERWSGKAGNGSGRNGSGRTDGRAGTAEVDVAAPDVPCGAQEDPHRAGHVRTSIVPGGSTRTHSRGGLLRRRRSGSLGRSGWCRSVMGRPPEGTEHDAPAQDSDKQCVVRHFPWPLIRRPARTRRPATPARVSTAPYSTTSAHLCHPGLMRAGSQLAGQKG
jgi:hypothetical protein